MYLGDIAASASFSELFRFLPWWKSLYHIIAVNNFLLFCIKLCFCKALNDLRYVVENIHHIYVSSHVDEHVTEVTFQLRQIMQL